MKTFQARGLVSILLCIHKLVALIGSSDLPNNPWQRTNDALHGSDSDSYARELRLFDLHPTPAADSYERPLFDLNLSAEAVAEIDRQDLASRLQEYEIVEYNRREGTPPNYEDEESLADHLRESRLRHDELDARLLRARQAHRLQRHDEDRSRRHERRPRLSLRDRQDEELLARYRRYRQDEELLARYRRCHEDDDLVARFLRARQAHIFRHYEEDRRRHSAQHRTRPDNGGSGITMARVGSGPSNAEHRAGPSNTEVPETQPQEQRDTRRDLTQLSPSPIRRAFRH